MRKDLLDWLRYYHELNEQDFQNLTDQEKQAKLTNYYSDVSNGWQEVKSLLLEK